MSSQRDAQRERTRARILTAAQSSLLEHGYAATSTLAVQARAGVSRGALLHHFPTRALMFGALVEHLVASNERAVREALAAHPETREPLRAALQVLYDALRRPAFQAELELWAAARTDAELRRALLEAERRARRDLHRVVDEVLTRDGVAVDDTSAELTVVLLRGLVTALPLREDPARSARLLDAWAAVLSTRAAQDETHPDPPKEPPP